MEDGPVSLSSTERDGVERLADALRRPDPLWSRAEILVRPSPVPARPGLYAWYIRDLPVPTETCHKFDGSPLVYVGIAPSRPGSKSTLRRRIRQHLRSNASASTLRLSLGSLLAAKLGLRLQPHGKRLTFGAGEADLNAWLSSNARVCWCEHEAPWAEVGAVPVGYNPVGGLYRKPRATKTRRRVDEFFELDEAARCLDAAIRLNQHPELVAAFLLTGGRRSEVFGLLVGDIDFDHRLVRIQPNAHRGLKRSWSERVVPLWPQLEEILRPYVAALDRGPDALLFPGLSGGMFTDLRKPLGVIADDLRIEVPRLTKFRHTYATARLQTTDNGKQISLWTVAKELGHKTVARVEDTYGHPSHYRPRGEVVEYRL